MSETIYMSGEKQESEPLLHKTSVNGEASFPQTKYKITAGLIVSIAFIGIVTFIGISKFSGPQNLTAADQAPIRFLSEKQSNCPLEKVFQELSQLEIELLRVPKTSLATENLDVLSDEEMSWLMQEKVPQNGVIQKHIRKEVRTLTVEEWQDYGRAVRQMKETYPTSGNRSEYDIMVVVHSPVVSPYAHFGPATLPWHRVYLDKYESILSTHVAGMSIPYWDTALDEPLPTPKDSIVWSDALFGTNNASVLSGVFSGHTNPSGYCTSVFGKYLQRGVHNKINRLQVLLNNNIIQRSVLNFTSFTDLTRSVTSEPFLDATSLLETYHGGVHSFIGGDIASIPCAPVDPIFWLWHASLDALWQEFRTESQLTDPQLEYPILPNNDPGYLPYAPMLPFSSFPNIYGLSDHFTNYRYEYTTRPTKYSCVTDSDCGSELGYLWCDQCARCVSKVVQGGDCTGLPDNACYCGNTDKPTVSACINNTCLCTSEQL